MADDNTSTDELEVLRRTVAELTAAKHKLREKVTELEGKCVTLKAAAEAAEAARYEAVVGIPVKNFIDQHAIVPELLASEFKKDYKIEDKDGKLIFTNASDEKPVRDKKGNMLEFNANNAYELLLGDKDNPRFKIYSHLLKHRASGGIGAGNSRQGQRTENKPAERLSLGIR